ncbi:MAG: SDR family oxidoreductase [Pseudomonadota bacterium]|nr:SDR family oxidoreductase [Pseudomonadota bacterium]
MQRRILITGAGGYIGSLLARRLAERHFVVGVDIREDPSAVFPFHVMDVRDPALADLVREHAIEQVVHLAAVLEDSGDRERDYDIDVNGTRNVLEACVQNSVRQLVVTSSGAAYGYHPDNPAWLDEQDPLRGNAEFAYSDHKRQVEELLASYREQHPRLKQLVLRPGTVLGAGTRNLITRLFEGRRLLAVAGSPSPFVFIWDEDVLHIIDKGVNEEAAGCFNLAGDGALSIHELGAILGKPVIAIPAAVLRTGLWIGNKLGLTGYTPAQINFLRYRPVLSNQRLKNEFGYQPRKSSEEVFRFYLAGARGRQST